MHQYGLNDPIWTTNIPHGNVSYEFADLMVVLGPNSITINNGALIHTLSLENGAVLSSYQCFKYNDGQPIPITGQGGCILAAETTNAVYIVDGGESLHKFNKVSNTTLSMKQASWQLPSEMKVIDVLIEAELLDDHHLLLVTPNMAGVIELNGTNLLAPNGAIYEPAHVLAAFSSEAGFTSSDVGYPNRAAEPMGESEDQEQMIVMGTQDGNVFSWLYQSNATSFEIREGNVNLNGFAKEIRDVRLTDLDDTGKTELLITTEDDARLLVGTSMIQKLVVDVPAGENVAVAFGDTLDDTTQLYATAIGENYSKTTGVVESSMFLSGGIVFEDIPTMIGLLVSIILMILLYVHSEWYVVNTVGILVGSGVIVMLGVSFVPTLIMVFMVAAAIYDAWAVYKSKHMLDLADTMINLNLPILLVAPQDSDYSFRAERTPLGDVEPSSDGPDSVSIQSSSQPRERVIKKSNDAMLMGLGDVIFPGMLVLSTLQYIGGDDGLIMAMATLFGSLVGYSVLMWYVGQGKAQAGLPLLNGGAILGYILGGFMTIGMAMFQFNISL